MLTGWHICGNFAKCFKESARGETSLVESRLVESKLKIKEFLNGLIPEMKGFSYLCLTQMFPNLFEHGTRFK